MSLAAVAPDPAAALVDGEQTLSPDEFAALVEKVKRVVAAVGRKC